MATSKKEKISAQLIIHHTAFAFEIRRCFDKNRYGIPEQREYLSRSKAVGFKRRNPNQRKAVSEKNHDMENNIGVNAKHGTQSHSRISNGGGAEEFQH